MTMGMNTNKIFKPTFLTGQVLEETKLYGYTRIEITYQANDLV